MRTILFSALAVGLLWASTGCASNPRVGNSITVQERVFGDYGITGHNGNYTILHGSKVTKLSVIGDNNTVTVEDGVTLYRIEFWGKGNTVIAPDTLFLLRTTEVGSNQIIRRAAAPAEPVRLETFPPTYVPPPTEAAPGTAIEKTPPAKTLEESTLPPEADVIPEESAAPGEETK